MSPNQIPDQIGSLHFADVQGPFTAASPQGSVYKIWIIFTATKYLWMYMSPSKKIRDILNKWIRSATPVMRYVQGMVSYWFQTDDGEFRARGIGMLLLDLWVVLLLVCPIL